MVRELSEPEITRLLNSARHAHLGCHAQGKTYVVPINFVWDGKRVLGITSQGMKVFMMRENPEVCLQIEDVQSLANWSSVILWGRFIELSGSERALAAGLLIDRYGPEFADADVESRQGRNVTPPRLDGAASEVIVYAIEVTERSGRAEG